MTPPPEYGAKSPMWIVLGGWATAPEILRPIFGAAAKYLDVNQMLHQHVVAGHLQRGWEDSFTENLRKRLEPHRPFAIVGWSCGAIAAYALAQRTAPHAAIFLSATPSFCRRAGYRHGQRASVLETMRAALAGNARQVLRDFYDRAGIGSAKSEPATVYTNEQLHAGLIFLQEATLLDAGRLPMPSLMLHGGADPIIPAQSGRELAAMAGGSFACLPGGHAFFLDAGNAAQIVVLIRQFIHRQGGTNASICPARRSLSQGDS